MVLFCCLFDCFLREENDVGIIFTWSSWKIYLRLSRKNMLDRVSENSNWYFRFSDYQNIGGGDTPHTPRSLRSWVSGIILSDQKQPQRLVEKEGSGKLYKKSTSKKKRPRKFLTNFFSLFQEGGKPQENTRTRYRRWRKSGQGYKPTKGSFLGRQPLPKEWHLFPANMLMKIEMYYKFSPKSETSLGLTIDKENIRLGEGGIECVSLETCS